MPRSIAVWLPGSGASPRQLDRLGEHLAALLVRHEMIVAEVRPADVCSCGCQSARSGGQHPARPGWPIRSGTSCRRDTLHRRRRCHSAGRPCLPSCGGCVGRETTRSFGRYPDARPADRRNSLAADDLEVERGEPRAHWQVHAFEPRAHGGGEHGPASPALSVTRPGLLRIRVLHGALRANGPGRLMDGLKMRPAGVVIRKTLEKREPRHANTPGSLHMKVNRWGGIYLSWQLRPAP